MRGNEEVLWLAVEIGVFLASASTPELAAPSQCLIKTSTWLRERTELLAAS